MKKLPFILVPLIALLCHTASFADTSGEEMSLEVCNKLYHSLAFEDAIACYKEIAAEKQSAAILYNIGNSYAQLDQAGYSILYFLRALSIDPGDSDISGNLAMVKKENGLFPPEKPVIKHLVNLLTLGQWSILCLLSLAGYLVFSFSRITRKPNYVLEACVITICIIVFSAGALAAGVRYKEWHQGVVIENSRLLISPFENGTSIGSIEPGRLVYPHKEHGDYWYVTDETGRKGWLQTEAFETILPQ